MGATWEQAEARRRQQCQAHGQSREMAKRQGREKKHAVDQLGNETDRDARETKVDGQ